MRRFLAIFGFVWTCFHAALAQTGPDFDALGAKLDGYVSAIAAENAATKAGECDFLISACKDSLVRQFTALKLYGHYMSSKLMGDDAVAVHIADEWFIPGKVAMKSELDLMNAKVFAEFNRSSLIGMKAPSLVLKDHSMQDVRLFEGSGDCRTILYFYDTGCSTCRLESPRLKELMSTCHEAGENVRLVAVYTGNDEGAWARYRVTSLQVDGAVHLWDPDMESGFQKLYGVLSTPKLFLISPDGTIEGRGLDTVSLKALLDKILQRDRHIWGGNEAMALFDGIFSSYGDTLKPAHVLEVAGLLSNATIAKGDTLSYRNLEGDLLYYLYSRKDGAFKEAAGPFIDGFILSRPVWTERDSSDVLPLAGMMHSLWELNPIGSKVAAMKIKGTLLRKGRPDKEGWFNTGRLRGRESWLVFYTRGCASCRETLDAARELSSRKRTRVLLINMDSLFEEAPETAHKALEMFDLSLLPHTVALNRRGIVQRRYVSLDKGPDQGGQQ